MSKALYPTLARRGMVLPTRMQASRRTSYEAGSATGSRSRTWNPAGSGPNAAATNNHGLIVRRARDAVRNDPWAKKSVTTWVSNAIGTGIQPYPQHPDKRIRASLKDLFADWVPDADADGRLDFYGLQVLAARGIFIDGEALSRLRPRRVTDGLAVPLQVQALEADHLPVELNQSLQTGEVVNGVQFNQIGQRTAYHMWNQHPGEYGRASIVPREIRVVPADQVVHAFQTLRPGQVRGVSELATVLLRLKTLDDFDDAVAFRQEVANLFAGFIRKPVSDANPNDPTDDGAGWETIDTDGSPMVALEPGTMQELAPGEEVSFASPPGPGAEYEGFMRQQLMAAFASVGVPYEIGTGDLRGISDRTLRVLVNEFHRLIEQYQWTVFIQQWCRPMWNAFIDMAYLAGVLSIPDYLANRRLYRRVRWVPQGWAYFNPVQDIKAKKDQVRAGFKSRSGVILEQGDDPDDVDEEIRLDNQRADDNEMVFDSDPRRVTGTGAASGADVSEPADSSFA
jgi:lambda family phage portal protein